MGLLENTWLAIRKVTDEWFDEDDWVIKTYDGYANEEKIVIRGRVIQEEGVINLDEDTVWDNLVNNIRAFATDKLKHSKINITHDGQTYSTYTDDEGYFYYEIKNIDDINLSGSKQWGKVHLELEGYVNSKQIPVQTEAHFILPHIHAKYIIISDLDDTILQTHVDSRFKLRMMYNTLFKNARTRLPFEQIPAVLNQMAMNDAGQTVNPIFYLSNSPWNLHEMIHAFLEINEIPDGPLFLRDFGLHIGDDYKNFKNHKTNSIKHLLSFYSLPFLLIGDATESDTQTYIDAFKTHPERIKGIFIRQSRKEKKNQAVREKMQANPEIPIVLFSSATDILAYCESHCI